MEKVRVFLQQDGNNKLAVVKVVKEHSDLGLKDAKAFVDNLECFGSDFISITNPENFEKDVNKIANYIVRVDHKKRKRRTSFIKLGIASESEEIEYLSDLLIEELLDTNGYLIDAGKTSGVKEIISKLLVDIDDRSIIKKLISKKA